MLRGQDRGLLVGADAVRGLLRDGPLDQVEVLEVDEIISTGVALFICHGHPKMVHFVLMPSSVGLFQF